MDEAIEESCSRLVLGASGVVIFVKGTWFSSHFNLSVTDGVHAWTCHATDQAVANRAAGWDETVTEYLERVKRYLGHQQPDSIYGFVPDGDNRKLSWTMEKLGTKLEAKWKCEKARTNESKIREILDFLMDSNIKLSEEMVRKTKSFERMQIEAEKCLKQTEAFKNEKQQFEVEIYKKFVAVLNSKKAKLQELQDKLAMFEPAKENDHGTEDDLGTETESAADDDAINSDNEGDQVEKSSDPLELQNIGKNEASDTELAMHNRVVGKEDNASVTGGLIHEADHLVESDSKLLDVPVKSAADLLAESNYTSAPKRRRRL